MCDMVAVVYATGCDVSDDELEEIDTVDSDSASEAGANKGFV